MADVHDTKTRSYNMSQIKGKNTKPEMLVRKFLHANGFRYRLHVKNLPGKPDIVLPKYKTVIFVHGCFWHGHEHCRYYVIPKTRTEWWSAKIQKNIIKDAKVLKDIKAAGWKAIIVWECHLKKDKLEAAFTKLMSRLKSRTAVAEKS
ncbi:MAG: DNA mismatch endonuclease Vsr [Sphingobacteriales bacterium]|nr:MAG: DNA mismatch endonuclease Vsr [Sphingobacteriales bacterium]